MQLLPKSITLTTGEQDRVQQTIDDFFTETKVLAEARYNIDSRHFQIKSGEIAYQPNTVTNDRITYLLYKETILACVLETRTERNNVHYDFFRNLESLVI